MFGLARLFERPYFVCVVRAPGPATAATTSRSVVHLPCAGRWTLNVNPCSSTAALAEAEILVSRANVSRR